MQIRSEVGNPGHSSPVPEFEEHYAALCDLLRAYSEVASKPEGWSEPVVGVWRTELTGGEPDEDDLEHPLSRIFCGSAEGLDIRVRSERVEYQGRSGTLFLTECGTLLTLLQELRIQGCSLPRTAQGLSRRLRSAKLRALEFLDEELAPELPHLRRTAKSRPIGFFREDDVHDCPGGDLRAGTVIGLAQ
jgi:hypothetical protein